MDNSELLNKKKWSELPEDDKAIHVKCFLDNYSRYNKYKVVDSIKTEIKAYFVESIKKIFYVFVAMVVLGIIITLIPNLMVLLFLFFLYIIYKLYIELKNLSAIKQTIKNKKTKGSLFIEYLNENNIIYDTDISPSMILELYKE